MSVSIGMEFAFEISLRDVQTEMKFGSIVILDWYVPFDVIQEL